MTRLARAIATASTTAFVFLAGKVLAGPPMTAETATGGTGLAVVSIVWPLDVVVGSVLLGLAVALTLESVRLALRVRRRGAATEWPR